MFRRVGMHVRIETHLAQDEDTTFDTGLMRSFGTGVKKRTAQAVAARVGKDQEATHGRDANTSAQVIVVSEHELGLCATPSSATATAISFPSRRAGCRQLP
jgi:hypothetical protein